MSNNRILMPLNECLEAKRNAGSAFVKICSTMFIKAFIMCGLIMRSPSNLHLFALYKILPPFYSQYATVGSSAWAPLHVYWDF